MKKPEVDYRQFRLSKINRPEYRHLWLLLGWVAYFLLYMITENFIPEESCHEMWCALDDKVPFTESFVIAYVFWYLLVVGSLLWYLLYDIERFKQLQIFIMITQAIAMITYICYPSVQKLRPDLSELGRSNFFTWILGIIYSFDTPTGVCPSLHVGYSFAIASVALKDRNLRWGVRAFVLLAAIVISASTAFVKQHSVVDIWAGALLGAVAGLIVYGKSWYLPRIKRLLNRNEQA